MVSVLEGYSTFDRVFVSKSECVNMTSNLTSFSILLETICKSGRIRISLKIVKNVLENVHRNVSNPFQHDIDPLDYTKNQAGFHHSHKYGFGLMDSWRLVNLAKVSIVQGK